MNLSLKSFEVLNFQKDLYYYRNPFRVQFLDLKSKNRLNDLANDLKFTECFTSSVSDFELLLFHIWIRDKKFSELSLLKNNLIFLLASTNSAVSDMSSLSIFMPFYLSQSYYVRYDSMSTNGYGVFSNNFLLNSIYIPVLLRKRILRHVSFYVKDSQFSILQQMKNFQPIKLPKIQADYKAFNFYFTQFRPFYKFLYGGISAKTDDTFPGFSAVSFIFMFSLLILFFIFSFLGFFKVFPWDPILNFFKILNTSDFQHQLYILHIKRIDVAYLNKYFLDLDQTKFFISVRYFFWCMFWSFKAAFYARYYQIIPKIFGQRMAWYLNRRLSTGAVDRTKLDFFDRWWF